MSKLVKELAKVLKKETAKEVKPYDTSAEVVRIEGGTAWVHIPGGVDETPVDLTINAQVGDTVQLRVSGGNAWIVGNKTAPPTDDRVAIKAQGTADVANVAAQNAVKSADNAEAAAQSALSSATAAATAATNAQNSANAAQASATNANEYATRALNGLSAVESVTETLTWITAHGTMTLTTDVTLDPTHVYFVVDPLGDYDVGGTHYSLVIDPDVDDIGTYYELSIDESLNNYVGTHLALDSEGLWLLPASTGTNKVLIATGAGSTYTTPGTYMIDSGGALVASFRQDGATMSSGGTQIAHLGYGPGTDSGGGTSNAPYYTLGTRATTSSPYNSSSTYAVGDMCVYNDVVYVCITAITTPEAWNSTHWINAIGNNSAAVGSGVISANSHSYAEGRNTKAIGYVSHAEGSSCGSTGINSHAEGTSSKATNNAAHAEGAATKASGYASHAEGEATVASAGYTHAQNFSTCADQTYQTAIGLYNTKNHTSNLFAIGNGTADNARSDAFTVSTSGNTYAAGNMNIASGKKYKINGTDLAASDVGALPTSGGTLTGTLTLSSHSSAIGTVKAAYASATSVATQTNTNLTSISLEAGTWVITGGVRFPNNATGYRRMNIATSSAASWADVQLPASSGASTQLAYTVVVNPTSTKTYYLNCYHNAGTTLNLIAGSASSENGINFLRAVRIA